ncbi:MAG: hypothetical protein A3J74_01280 [Elusimicrobia bacterium RIFCSPHIGHO2_02_FULL_57_9]|nr:MAG: hypothetical protein A3J74_01280 [Elusimicrobia bacterium RIFCSPHIGHO2_02_FULL_57_9]
MKNIVFIGSHLGYPMDTTPLGGGAMVALQLTRHWVAYPGFNLCVVGSGPQPPSAVEYVQLPKPAPNEQKRNLVGLSELGYARFCRQFEAAATQWVFDNQYRYGPENTCIIVNDISEGPTLPVLSRAGYPIISLWHVDVVDYFNKLYLRQMVLPETVVRVYERSRNIIGRLYPDVLRLIFEKQRQTILYSHRLILPSRAMAETIFRCYGDIVPHGEMARRTVVLPWGIWQDGVDDNQAEAEAARLREYYQIKPETKVLMTLSRIAPEKGLHLLLDALRRLERSGRVHETCLFICGESAFMQGVCYLRRVQAKAAKLKKTRIFFPGYLAALEKKAYFKLAQLFISPSIHESYGLTMVEAMQAGLPILAGDHYGARDGLKPGFGRKVSYSPLRQAPTRLAQALEELLANRQILAGMGCQARREAHAMPFEKAAQRVLDEALELAGSAR